MLNSYCYNRKTNEEDAAILAAVRKHHEKAKKELSKLDIENVVMTVLIGSQNYDIDDENSDIDTFTFFFPNMNDLMNATEPRSFTFAMEDGNCYTKDIRTAINLLKKTSPNSVEYFISKYKIYDPDFEDILRHYLDNNTRIYPMTHCNYGHMLQAIAGMAKQLTVRNMPVGKRYGHALRLMDMRYHFLESLNASSIIELRPGGDVDLVRATKRNTDEKLEEEYDRECEEIAGWLKNFADGYEVSEHEKSIEINGKIMIYNMQEHLFKRYITLNKNNLMETN